MQGLCSILATVRLGIWNNIEYLLDSILDECSSVDDFNKYIQIAQFIDQGEYKKELDEIGCTLKNCITSDWTFKETLNGELKTMPKYGNFVPPKSTLIVYYMTNSKVK